MGHPTLEFNQDHMVVRFGGMDAFAGLARTILIPYSTIQTADVGAPEWPGLTKAWGAGLRMPPLVLKGSIGDKPLGPYDRFFWQDRGTNEVLRLKLVGHPRYREVHLDVEEARAALERVEEGRKRVRG